MVIIILEVQRLEEEVEAYEVQEEEDCKKLSGMSESLELPREMMDRKKMSRYHHETKLPGPRVSIYDEITRPAFFHLRRIYQARVFKFTTNLRGPFLRRIYVDQITTNLPGPCFCLWRLYEDHVYDEFTLTRLRRIYQVRIFVYEDFTSLNPKPRNQKT